jgi:hypothetical protein
MSIVKNFEIEENFWKTYPQLKYPEEFKDLRTKDKTRDKAASSKYMWFIALCYDWESIFIKLEETERWKIVGKDFFNDEKFINRVDLKSAIEAYNKFQDTPAKRQYRELMKLMDDRSSFINGTRYSKDSYKMIEDMLKNASNIYDELEKIKQKVDQEESAGKVKGGANTSMIDDIEQ